MNMVEVPAMGAVPVFSAHCRDIVDDDAILGLWADGHNTFEIAKKLWLKEGDVANRLAWLRDRGAK